jgi:phosphatidate phosphatase APP1
MRLFYKTLEKHFPDSFFMYVTASPWNVINTIYNFIKFNDFPSNGVIAKDLGPTETTLFSWGEHHKFRAIKELFLMFDKTQWILIGDDGQLDPQIYKKITDDFPERVKAVFIRQLTTAEQVFASLASIPYSSTDGSVVPIYYGKDGFSLKEQFSKSFLVQ